MTTNKIIDRIFEFKQRMKAVERELQSMTLDLEELGNDDAALNPACQAAIGVAIGMTVSACCIASAADRAFAGLPAFFKEDK